MAGGSSIIGISSASMASLSATPIVGPYAVSFKSFLTYLWEVMKVPPWWGYLTDGREPELCWDLNRESYFEGKRAVCRSLKSLRSDDGKDT